MANEVQRQTADQLNENGQNSKDSIEYRVLLSYIQRNGAALSQIPPSIGVDGPKNAMPTKPPDHHKPGKKNKHKFLKFVSCIRPAKEDASLVTKNHRPRTTLDTYQEDVEPIVKALTVITDSIHFSAEEIETDNGDVVERIVELLKEQGDKLNEEIKNNQNLKNQLQSLMSYSFFERLVNSFKQGISLGECTSAPIPQRAEIALTCELISRLNAIGHHPMNRVLGFGTKYLQDHCTPWVNRRGGYTKVFSTDREELEEEEEEEVH